MADVDLTEYNGAQLMETAGFLLVLTWISVMLRTYVRAILTKGFMTDDWIMLASQANFTTSCVFLLVGVTYGLGRHNKALAQGNEIQALKWQALATATYILNMMFIKLSIGFFLLRVTVQRRYTYTIYISMGVIGVWSLALFFWDIFQCKPVKAQWDYTIPGLQCVSAQEVVNGAYALSVMTIISDWLYALLPIPMIWNVHMSKQAKANVVVILGLGIFASIATLIRLKFLSDLTDTSDILFAGTDAMVWTLVEPGVAIIASSLVTIRPLLRQLRLRGFESTGRSNALGRRGGRSGGRSGGPLSGKGLGSKMIGSQTQRNKDMPGYGLNDVTLVNMERGIGGKGFASQGTTITSRTRGEDSASDWGVGMAISIPEHRDTATPGSEVYVIEGPTSPHGMDLWGEDSPVSIEESSQIQGLSAPSRAASRFSNNPFRSHEFPIQR